MPETRPTVTGRVVLVGAGPGAADLITLRGARLLAKADVVLFDALTDQELRTLAPRARWIDVGKRGTGCGDNGHTAQQRINALLVHWARSVPLTVRLKGGDPSVFARAEEELQALAEAGISAEIIPGVTAALAAAADARRPLTRRGRGRTVALETAATADRSPAVRTPAEADTLVFYMAGKVLAPLSRRLVDRGWSLDDPVLVVSNAGAKDMLASSHTVATLAEAAVLHSGRPLVVTVGVGAEPLPLPHILAEPGMAATPAPDTVEHTIPVRGPSTT